MKLICVHGAGGSSLSYYYQERGFRDCEALSLPGHPKGKPASSIEGYMEWVRGYIWGKGYRDVVLVGHSMGGAITQLYALTYPEELKAIILIGTGARLRVDPQYLGECEAAIKDNSQWLKSREAALARVAPEVRSCIVEQARQIGPAVQLNDFLCCDKFDPMERLQEIRLPTLAIGGTEDVMTPVKYIEYLASKIPGARKLIVPGATHHVHLEYPDDVNAAIGDFLNSLA